MKKYFQEAKEKYLTKERELAAEQKERQEKLRQLEEEREKQTGKFHPIKKHNTKKEIKKVQKEIEEYKEKRNARRVLMFGVPLLTLMFLVLGISSACSDTSNLAASSAASNTSSVVNEVTSESTPPESIVPSNNTPAESDAFSEAVNSTSDSFPASSAPVSSLESAITIPSESTFNIHFIDVGQADAALVECDNHYMLVDGGNRDDSDKIYTILKNNNVPKLDIVVGTHGHEDHIGGIPGAFNYTTADVTLCPVTTYDSKAFENFKKYADQNGNGITIPNVGDTYPLGSSLVTILGVNSDSGANNSSIVLRIDYGNTSFLFTGDAEREAEQVILNSGANLNATVLKVGHHGSDTSTTYPFLREVMPQYAVISCGVGNSYGHPTDATLSKLRDADVKTFRTDMQGDIFCESDGATVTFTASKNKDADVFGNPGSTEGSVVAPAPTTSSSGSGNYLESNSATVAPTEQPTNNAPTQTYIANVNTGKFHFPNCPSVSKMKDSNKLEITGTRDEVIAQGYEPCKRCHP